MSQKIKIGDCFEGDPDCRPLICTDPDYADGYIGVMDRDGEEFAMNEDICDAIPTLHLPIGNDPKKYGGAWFDRIKSGEKKEEYREIEGANHTFRNCPLIWGVSAECAMDIFDSDRLVGDISFIEWMNAQNKKPLRVLHLTNGYGHSKPQLWAHIEEITIGRGNPAWGAPDRDVFIIKLGPVFHTKNLKG